jgi:hypothetical protein
MSSTHVTYDPTLFLLERAEVVSAMLGELILGVSRLGAETSAWIPVPTATFTMSAGYSVNDDATLIIEADSASVALSYWDTAGDVLTPGDRVQASYDDLILFRGTVDATSLTYVADPAAPEHGATRRVDFTATVVGTYAAALGKTVCWTALPAEPPIDRIRRWVTVEGWVA